MKMLLHKIGETGRRFFSSIDHLIDPALNLGVVLISLVVVIAFVRAGDRQSSVSANQPKPASERIDRRVSLPGVDWSKSEKTLLMFLNTHCGFCKQSEPFYHRLSSQVTDHQKLRIIALFPERLEESKEYLDCAGITVDDIKQAAPDSVKIKGTPTLVLVDKNGIAKNGWIGALSPAQEAEVFASLDLKSAVK
jgi:thiol-disulfide isomerase/thioredoxin